MSKIEQLIKKFCPKGVEWVSLGEIATDFFRGFVHNCGSV